MFGKIVGIVCFIGMIDAPTLGAIMGLIAGVIMLICLAVNTIKKQNEEHRKIEERTGEKWWKSL